MVDGKPSTMTTERVHLLEALGFVWDRHDGAWKEKVQELREYQAKHGDTLVPCNYKSNQQLAVWVKCQRRQYKLFLEGKPCAISEERIAELEKEGFQWEARIANEKPNGQQSD